jgi:Zn-dependent M28 family amino/carboxypeptidase
MQAHTENLFRHVEFLTSIYPYRNYKNIESLHKAADYIEDGLKKNGLPTTRQKWEAKENFYENIIASYQPGKRKRFIIGAHYDVYKEQPGADDNASSIAGLLEMARMLTENGFELDYGIDFVAFCLEEPPFFKKKEMGSYIHAKSVDNEDKDYIGMIALEMIGYYRREKETAKEIASNSNRLIVSGIKKYDGFNKKISKLLKTKGKIDSRRLSYADDYQNNGPSDHRNYWQFDVPAVMVIGTGGHGNPNYHKASDTIETLDFEIMSDAVNSIAHALFNFSK